MMWSIISYAYWSVFVFFDEMFVKVLGLFLLIGLLVLLLSFKRCFGFFVCLFVCLVFFLVYLGSSPSSNVFFFFFQLEDSYFAYCDCFIHQHEYVIAIHTSPPF